MVKFDVVEEFGAYNIVEKYSPFHTYILGASCSSDKTKCSPYKATLYKGKYKFELWGSGSTFHHNGAYVSGELSIEQQLTLFFFVGGYKSPFNSVEIGDSNGTLGNGATDIRLFYDGKWDSFESLRSRIIVAGAGGNSVNQYVDQRFGVCNVSGQYGYGGGLNGYSGLNKTCSSSIAYSVVYPGFPGLQTEGGNGGHGGYCQQKTGGGGKGKFGIGGIPGKVCIESSKYTANEGYAGSGGYYGSGGSGGGIAGHSSSTGTSGGSSFISGHRGCNAISFDSTEDNITHTGLPWHYSGIVFGNSVMIDGHGKRWSNETAGDNYRMPSIKEKKFYGEGIGHSDSGFIKITLLSCHIHTIRYHRFGANIIFVVIIYTS